MRPAIVLITLLLAVTAPAEGARRRAVTAPWGERILWVAAHPDDELLVAPFLARRCREGGALCAIAVATRGESGTCELAVCYPGLAHVRSAELAASAAFLGAYVVHGDFADGSSASPADVLVRWRGEGGGIASFLRDAVEQFRPDLVLTFDPRHGSTCHPDHRAVARAVLDLRDSGELDVPVALLTTRAAIAGSWDAVLFDPGLGDATLAVDATEPLPRLGRVGWDVLIEVARIHASQFPPRAIEALSAVEPADRRIGLRFLAPAETLNGDRCTAE